jgi:tRNA G18 (ribose-2'-O)-methylase SpoU
MNDQYINAVDFFKEKFPTRPQHPAQLILAAWELRTPENLGAIVRLAGNLGVAQVWFIHQNFQLNLQKIKYVAHTSLSHVDFKMVTEQQFLAMIPPGYQTIALETSSLSTNIFTTKLPQKTILICGNERHGMPESFINQCHSSVFIPLPGLTRSMNVSHALTIAAFEWAKQNLPALLTE